MTTSAILRNLKGNLQLYLMKAGIHQLEVLPSTRKEKKKTNRKERLFSSPGPNYFPCPVPEGGVSLPIFFVACISFLFVSSISLLSVVKRISRRRQKTNSLMLSDTKKQKSDRKNGKISTCKCKRWQEAQRNSAILIKDKLRSHMTASLLISSEA